MMKGYYKFFLMNSKNQFTDLMVPKEPKSTSLSHESQEDIEDRIDCWLGSKGIRSGCPNTKRDAFYDKKKTHITRSAFSAVGLS